MIQQKAYAYGFSKTAEAYGVDPTELYKLSGILKVAEQIQMRKQAGKFGTMARLMAKLSPKVDPKKLNWFTRLFTDSHSALAKSNPIRKKRFDAKLNWGPESASAGPSVGFGSNLPPVLRNITRLSPLKILAGVTAGGGSAALVNALKKDKDNGSKNLTTDTIAATTATPPKETKSSIIDTIKNMDPELKKKLLIGLGVGATGLVGAGIASSLLGSGRK